MKKILRALTVSLILFLTLSTVVLGADTWSYYVTITVKDTGGTSRNNVPVLSGISGGGFNSLGYIDADGLDTRLYEGSGTTDVTGQMMASSNYLFVIPTLTPFQQRTYRLYLNYAPDRSGWNLVVGDGGYVTTGDNPLLEPGDDFEIEISGYFDMSAGNIGDSIALKTDAIKVYVSAANTLKVEITGLAAADLTGAMTSGVHIVKVTLHNSYIALYVDNILKDDYLGFPEPPTINEASPWAGFTAPVFPHYGLTINDGTHIYMADYQDIIKTDNDFIEDLRYDAGSSSAFDVVYSMTYLSGYIYFVTNNGAEGNMAVHKIDCTDMSYIGEWVAPEPEYYYSNCASLCNDGTNIYLSAKTGASTIKHYKLNTGLSQVGSTLSTSSSYAAFTGGYTTAFGGYLYFASVDPTSYRSLYIIQTSDMSLSSTVTIDYGVATVKAFNDGTNLYIQTRANTTSTYEIEKRDSAGALLDAFTSADKESPFVAFYDTGFIYSPSIADFGSVAGDNCEIYLYKIDVADMDSDYTLTLSSDYQNDSYPNNYYSGFHNCALLSGYIYTILSNEYEIITQKIDITDLDIDTTYYLEIYEGYAEAGEPSALTTDGNYIYWSFGDYIPFVYKIDATSGALASSWLEEDIYDYGSMGIFGLVSDGTNLYVMTDNYYPTVTKVTMSTMAEVDKYVIDSDYSYYYVCGYECYGGFLYILGYDTNDDIILLKIATNTMTLSDAELIYDADVEADTYYLSSELGDLLSRDGNNLYFAVKVDNGVSQTADIYSVNLTTFTPIVMFSKAEANIGTSPIASYPLYEASAYHYLGSTYLVAKYEDSILGVDAWYFAQLEDDGDTLQEYSDAEAYSTAWSNLYICGYYVVTMDADETLSTNCDGYYSILGGLGVDLSDFVEDTNIVDEQYLRVVTNDDYLFFNKGTNLVGYAIVGGGAGGGITVPDTANDFVWMGGNTMPYANYIKIQIDDVNTVWYQPITIISGTTLPDRQGAAQNGVITYGSNTDLDVAIGSLVSYESTIAGSGEPGSIGDTVKDATLPNDWYASGDGSDLPFYAVFNSAASDMGWTTQTLYLYILLGMAIVVGLGVLLFTGSTLMAILGCGTMMGFGVNMHIVSGWMMMVFISLAIGLLFLARKA